MPPHLDPVARFDPIDWISSTGSTNADLIERLRSDPQARGHGQVLIAEEQTAGRGRRDRRWEMPAGGGILLSAYVPWSNAVSVSLVPLALGIAAVDVAAAHGRVCRLKWPNDLVSAGHRKVAGMLSELLYHENGQLAGVVVGFGCNVSWPPSGRSDLPEAVSLDRLGGEPIDRARFVAALLDHLDSELRGLTRSGPAYLVERYRDRSATIGSDVRIHGEGDHPDVVGRAVDIDHGGRLVLLVDDELRTVDVGDVVHLRAVDDDLDDDGAG